MFFLLLSLVNAGIELNAPSYKLGITRVINSHLLCSAQFYQKQMKICKIIKQGWCYPTPSEGWELGKTLRIPNGLATHKDLEWAKNGALISLHNKHGQMRDTWFVLLFHKHVKFRNQARLSLASLDFEAQIMLKFITTVMLNCYWHDLF